MNRFISIASLLLPSLLLQNFLLQNQAFAMDYTERDEVRAFVKELAAAESFDEKELLSLFKHAEYKQKIVDAISRPAEKVLNWDAYQDIFLTERRIEAGVEFMYENRDALAAASKTYGVPPVIITAIIGVETMYGRITGGYRVLDALATLSFDYPPRSRFFRSELKHFILLAREEKRMITDLTGSYAGAMGMGQFIPSSYRRYAVDFDQDGHRDIWNNPTDAIGSVANYLAEHGWQREGRVTVAVDAVGVPADIFNESLKPTRTVAELRELGLREESLVMDEMVSPMRLVGKQGDEFWLGLKNFYVITRYNHSKLYAMAVFQLSEGLRKGSAEFAVR
ncbi:MAG: lytic murein transglycosylase B [Gammaproteobacteria bacterium]|jgi:membrane-bound lytic murein transglycosylase B|nr:lytic murein transglycosylase B [Gammaproteobacteria bacterium]MBT4494164.1 lytic murein transglycosylase B [Gammaproteobacteria bacterium]MBT7372113.1 lytic murein transglycosylase B [Gammaproteobacteria bacterium]